MDNKALYRRFVDEIVVAGRLELLDECFHPDVKLPGPGGHDALRGQLQEQTSGLDFGVVYEHQFADGDWVITHMTLTMSMIGEFMGNAPTGKTAVIQEVEAVRIQDNLIVEMWSVLDLLDGMRQLGLAGGLTT
jgi:predicted ester cyclase